MQRTHEILSLAAYLPLEVLPESVTEEIMEQIRRGVFKDFNFDDDNTELYFLKEQGSAGDYSVTISTVYSEDEPPDDSNIYLTELTDEEQQLIDALIQIRVIQALRHIDD